MAKEIKPDYTPLIVDSSFFSPTLLREDKSEKIDWTYIADMKPAFEKVIQRLMYGEKKYARLNFMNCKDPQTFKESFLRHAVQAVSGMTDEPHIEATIVNGLIWLMLEERKNE